MLVAWLVSSARKNFLENVTPNLSSSVSQGNVEEKGSLCYTDSHDIELCEYL